MIYVFFSSLEGREFVTNWFEREREIIKFEYLTRWNKATGRFQNGRALIGEPRESVSNGFRGRGFISRVYYRCLLNCTTGVKLEFIIVRIIANGINPL